ncbi:MAG: hypothetical protein JXA77_15335 [Bacteroidales bacterium]|nr:hypothetical protein [Bacteroidales bacterium]MBN2820241.1 hypothetical protein [Bacteroidales bacterium]
MINIEEKTSEFIHWYDKKLLHHTEYLALLCKLLETIPRVELVSGRIKTSDECISKFNRKYLSEISSFTSDFYISDFISDLIGVRAICFYTEDIQYIRRELRKFFDEKEITDKSGKLEKTEDKFGYRSLHLQLSLKNRLKTYPEAAKFKNIRFELQIRTVIQDAWSVLDHKIKYKKSIPQKLKRRINRLSALFEIADDEFLSVKAEIEKEEKKIDNRIKKGGKIESHKPLDVFRFLFVALKYFPNYNFIEFKVDEFVQEILLLKSNFTEGELNEALKNHLPFANNIELKIKQKLNPYSKIRYCLFKLNNTGFNSLLTEYQKSLAT